MEYFIRVNGQDVHINRDDPARPRLDGAWGGEQCEGCGNDIAETGRVQWHSGVPAAYVTCRECGATYSVDSTDREIQ
jgi:hypothetical protein